MQSKLEKKQWSLQGQSANDKLRFPKERLKKYMMNTVRTDEVTELTELYKNGTIQIDRQQQYQDSLIKLVPPKTRNANRTIYLCDKLIEHLKAKKKQAMKDSVTYAAVRQQKQRFIEDLDGSLISCTELVGSM